MIIPQNKFKMTKIKKSVIRVRLVLYQQAYGIEGNWTLVTNVSTIGFTSDSPKTIPLKNSRSERTWTFMHHYSNYTAQFIRLPRYTPIKLSEMGFEPTRISPKDFKSFAYYQFRHSDINLSYRYTNHHNSAFCRWVSPHHLVDSNTFVFYNNSLIALTKSLNSNPSVCARFELAISCVTGKRIKPNFPTDQKLWRLGESNNPYF